MPATNIEDMISGAANRADEVSTNLPATQQDSTAVRVQPTFVASAPSLDNLMNSSMSVDYWLKVSEDGLKLSADGKNALLDNIDVIINMAEVVATKAIKFGNPAQYYKTYDGLICSDGQTRWEDALLKGDRNNATPYESADIPMILDQDIQTKDGAVIIEKGKRLGYSLSTTNKDAFAKFLRQTNDANLRHSTVRVKLGYEAKTNKNKNVWGIVTFDLTDEVGE